MTLKSKLRYYVAIAIGLTSLMFINAVWAPSFSIQSSFAAVIVKNLEASASWYKTVLRGNLGEISSDKATYKVQILEAPGLTVELLELKDSVDPDKLVSGATRVRGHFKIGYKVSNLDEFMTHLSSNGITVSKVYGSKPHRNFLIEDPDGNLVQFFE